MQTFPCQIFPKSGYKNEQFLIRNNQPESSFDFQIIQDDVVVREGSVTDTTHIILEPIVKAGLYKFNYVFEDQQMTEYFEVKDAIRLGSSIIKNAYCFENLSLIVFVMKDRIRFYDETAKYYFEENRFSPTDIIQIDDDHLLFITKIGLADGITNYALYSISRSEIKFELLDDYSHLHYGREQMCLWVINKKSQKIECYSLAVISNAQQALLYSSQFTTIQILEPGKMVLCQSGDHLTYINLSDYTDHKIKLSNNMSVDVTGQNCYCIENGGIICQDLLDPENSFKTILPEDFRLADVGFVWTGKEFPRDNSNDIFEQEKATILRKYTADYEHTGSYQCISLPEEIEKKAFTTISYRPFRNGKHLIFLRLVQVRNIRRVIYRKNHYEQWESELDIKQDSLYELLLSKDNQFISIEKSGRSYEIVAMHKERLFLRNGKNVMVFDNGTLIATLENIDYNSVKIVHYGERSYLFANRFGDFSIISLDDLQPVINRTAVLNHEYINEHQKILINRRHGTGVYIDGYDLNTGCWLNLKNISFWQDHCSSGQRFKFEKDYYQTCSGVLIDPYTFEKRDSVLGDIIGVSRHLNKIISKRGTEIYLSNFHRLLKKYLLNEINFPVIEYDEAFLSPDGQYLVVQKESNEYSLYDIAANREINFFSGKFLAFSKDGQLIVETDKTRSAVVYDPLTMQEITPANYQYYLFKSPDGELYADLSQSFRYYDRIRKCYIDNDECRKLRAELGDQSSTRHSSFAATVTRNRQEYFNRHREALKSLNILSPSSLMAESVLKTEHFIHIGICGTDIKKEIVFPEHLGYYNYSAFSADNRFFAYVGKPHVRGHICIYQIDYNKAEKTIRLQKKYSSDFPGYASWVCAFSKFNVFATYDSSPDTYLIAADKLFDKTLSDKELTEGRFEIHPESVFARYKSWRIIKGKSFVCFSPSGKYMVLSEQGYEPLTLGGYGHVGSCAIHIVSTNDGHIIRSFVDHGAPLEKKVDYKKLIFAAFSEDEKQLMSLSSDGVILVRNIESLRTAKHQDINLELATVR